ncbi:molybdenum cofactor biosynthesis protein MoaE [Nocardia higoensis]|uniref:Molybdenum cofactor biosynthesis protein MoaE n=2 Tax=Nocardia higoensis TaxID=228599 RepID=A0ABS0D8W0_9NOCA|nr:molybdenum cofactor biosynthesis protein MoaE [Nocardia higoensis]MBF6354886.1 molybdenum cofactor biosynthesis protein MoaE [Nocardia higoensis]
MTTSKSVAGNGTEAPPGGATTGVRLVRINEQPLNPAAAEAAVTGPEHGAVVVFTGKVRDHDGGQAVSALEYSAHPRAAHFLRVCCEAIATSTGLPVAAEHRVGDLGIGDLAIVVAVAAPHRAEAFAACAELVDRIKHEVPIWKRQQFADGLSEWVNACH